VTPQPPTQERVGKPAVGRASALWLKEPAEGQDEDIPNGTSMHKENKGVSL